MCFPLRIKFFVTHFTLKVNKQSIQSTQIEIILRTQAFPTLAMTSILGRVPFGRVNSSPPVIFAQMVHVYSTFMAILGVTLVVLEMTGIVERAFEQFGDSAAKDSKAVAAAASHVHYTFFLSATSLFVPKEIGVSATYGSAALKFTAAHVLTSFMAAFPIAFCIQRRRYAADFVITLYGAYIASTAAIAQSLAPLASLVYWGSLAVGMGVTWVVTTQVCYRREMAEIRVEGDAVPNAAELAVNGGSPA